ncbi:hypothetical protein EV121DRAFT_268250, partial [Schizophyllum commune]
MQSGDKLGLELWISISRLLFRPTRILAFAFKHGPYPRFKRNLAHFLERVVVLAFEIAFTFKSIPFFSKSNLGLKLSTLNASASRTALSPKTSPPRTTFSLPPFHLDRPLALHHACSSHSRSIRSLRLSMAVNFNFDLRLLAMRLACCGGPALEQDECVDIIAVTKGHGFERV